MSCRIVIQRTFSRNYKKKNKIKILIKNQKIKVYTNEVYAFIFQWVKKYNEYGLECLKNKVKTDNSLLK